MADKKTYIYFMNKKISQKTTNFKQRVAHCAGLKKNSANTMELYRKERFKRNNIPESVYLGVQADVTRFSEERARRKRTAEKLGVVRDHGFEYAEFKTEYGKDSDMEYQEMIDTCKEQFPENWKATLIKLAADGASENELRAELMKMSINECQRSGKPFNVTLHNSLWFALIACDPEFADTLGVCQTLSMGWWESIGRKGSAGEKDINAGAYKFQMINRFRGDWKASETFSVENADDYLNMIAKKNGFKSLSDWVTSLDSKEEATKMLE